MDTNKQTEDTYQIDYLPVGEGSRGGDAIAMRFGNLQGPRHEQVVMVIDGGTKDSGKALVDHIQNYYGTDTVDVVIATHSDADHVSGLTEVLNDLTVGELWMHEPWALETNLQTALNRALTGDPRLDYVKASLGQAENLAKIARQKNIPIVNPYAGMAAFGGMVQILGPDEAYYRELLPQFRMNGGSENKAMSIIAGAVNFVKEEINKVRETMEIETLRDGNEHFSAENNSSVIMLLTVAGRKILFTGDADADALTRAADYAEGVLGISVGDLHLLHVPHHGSKQNVGPTILNRVRAVKAQISAPPESKKHPHQSVVNALIRRGTRVLSTQGSTVLHFNGGDGRPDWGPARALEFVEEFDD